MICTARQHMQSVVLAMIDSVCPSVRLSVRHSPISCQNSSYTITRSILILSMEDFTTFNPYTNTIFLGSPYLEPYRRWYHLAHTLKHTENKENFHVWMAIPDNAVRSAHSQQQLRRLSKNNTNLQRTEKKQTTGLFCCTL